MEKRLRSSLQSSAEEFLSSATKLNLKSSKSTLKTLIHAISPSSPLISSLPASLQSSISNSIESYRDLLQNLHPDAPDPVKSPPSKRLRRSSRKNNPNSPKKESKSIGDRQGTAEKLQIQVQVVYLCVSHPKGVFSPLDLLPPVQMLHDNLLLFHLDVGLLLEIASLCELYWKENFPGREMLISQSLPFLLSRSLTSKKKVDVHRVYALREALSLFDFDDESIEDLKSLLIRCVIAPLYLKTADGRGFLAFMLGLSLQLLKEVLAMIKSQISFGRKSVLEAYGEILFRAWKGLECEFKDELENGFLQGLIDSAIHANSRPFAASIRRILGGFITQRVTDGVEKFLFRLAEPVIFRSLQVANSNVRLNALHLLLDLFPLEDPDATKEAKDILFDKQFFLLEKLLMDECPDVRVVAVEGCCRVLHLFWEINPPATITKILTKIFDDMSHDICHEVRLSTVNGIAYLLGNPQSHEILKVLLPRLGHLMLDTVLSIRAAVLDLLLNMRDIRAFQFNKVVSLDLLLSALATDQSQVAQKVTRLLMPSYFPSNVSAEEACNRCVTLIKRSPEAGARFCEYATLEGASLESVMELVKSLMNLVLSHNKMDSNKIKGILASVNYLCISLVNEPSYKNALKELFAGEQANRLFAAASSGGAESSMLNIFSLISPEDVSELVEECMHRITNCSGISSNVKLQDEVRSAHKFLLSVDGFDDIFEALANLLQKTAYRCHIKFGVDIPKQNAAPQKRKKGKPSIKSSAKWKHTKGKTAPSFEDDYLIAVGIAWQIKDMLVSEDFRKAILQSQSLENSFSALKVISEASILQGGSCENVDANPVMAYTALALHMTLQKTNLSTKECGTQNDRTNGSPIQKTLLDKTADHLLNCTDKMLAAGDFGKSGKATADKTRSNKTNKETQMGSSSSNNNGSQHDKAKLISHTKMFTAILKFILDSVTMGFLSNIHIRYLTFASLYLKHVISILSRQSSSQIQFKDDELKEGILYIKSSFSYAAKLLNLTLKDSNEAKPPLLEVFGLANDLLDLIASVELYLGSSVAARLAATAKPWLPDLILALGSGCILKNPKEENTYLTVLSLTKQHFPSWPLVLAKTELRELSNASSDEDNDVLEAEEFPVLRKIIEMIVSLLKGNQSVLDAVGVVFLAYSVVGLERKDFGLVLGMIQFVCVKLVDPDDKEWNALDMMLSCLPEIYPQIEREIEENSDEVEMEKLQSARVLLEPVWLYHVYETGRFTVMEE